jgi:hypothetical protein
MSEGECGRRGLCPGGRAPDRHAELVTDFCSSTHSRSTSGPSKHSHNKGYPKEWASSVDIAVPTCQQAPSIPCTLCQSPAALLAALLGPDRGLFTCGRTTHLHTKTKLSCRANRSILCADVLFPGHCPDS